MRIQANLFESIEVTSADVSVSNEKMKELEEKYAETEVKLEKGYSSYVDEITVKYNTVNLRYEKGDIYDVVAELSKLLAGEGILGAFTSGLELDLVFPDPLTVKHDAE